MVQNNIHVLKGYTKKMMVVRLPIQPNGIINCFIKFKSQQFHTWSLQKAHNK